MTNIQRNLVMYYIKYKTNLSTCTMFNIIEIFLFSYENDNYSCADSVTSNYKITILSYVYLYGFKYLNFF